MKRALQTDARHRHVASVRPSPFNTGSAPRSTRSPARTILHFTRLRSEMNSYASEEDRFQANPLHHHHHHPHHHHGHHMQSLPPHHPLQSQHPTPMVPTSPNGGQFPSPVNHSYPGSTTSNNPTMGHHMTPSSLQNRPQSPNEDPTSTSSGMTACSEVGSTKPEKKLKGC